MGTPRGNLGEKFGVVYYTIVLGSFQSSVLKKKKKSKSKSKGKSILVKGACDHESQGGRKRSQRSYKILQLLQSSA